MEDRINFEKYSWSEFEQLTFSYAYLTKEWSYIDWLGHAGKDGGRDIWAVAG